MITLTLSKLAVLAALTVAVTGSQGAIVTGLFNTGVDHEGKVLPINTLDPHYNIYYEQGAYVRPVVYNPQSPDWLPYVTSDSPSAWIGPHVVAPGEVYPTDPEGEFLYQLKFDLRGYDPSTVIIQGSWGSDNQSSVFLNGVDTGFFQPEVGFHALKSFVLSDGFAPGLNILEFRVTNGGGPSGLLVADLSGTGTVVPEPSTYVAGALLLIPFCVQGMRRLRSFKSSRR